MYLVNVCSRGGTGKEGSSDSNDKVDLFLIARIAELFPAETLTNLLLSLKEKNHENNNY